MTEKGTSFRSGNYLGLSRMPAFAMARSTRRSAVRVGFRLRRSSSGVETGRTTLIFLGLPIVYSMAVRVAGGEAGTLADRFVGNLTEIIPTSRRRCCPGLRRPGCGKTTPTRCSSRPGVLIARFGHVEEVHERGLEGRRADRFRQALREGNWRPSSRERRQLNQSQRELTGRSSPRQLDQLEITNCDFKCRKQSGLFGREATPDLGPRDRRDLAFVNFTDSPGDLRVPGRFDALVSVCVVSWQVVEIVFHSWILFPSVSILFVQ
jgi:hypothetical protein